jgi:hypothetical protein
VGDSETVVRACAAGHFTALWMRDLITEEPDYGEEWDASDYSGGDEW